LTMKFEIDQSNDSLKENNSNSSNVR